MSDGDWKTWHAILIKGAKSGKPLMEFLQGEIIDSQAAEIEQLSARVAELEADKALDAKAREQLARALVSSDRIEEFKSRGYRTLGGDAAQANSDFFVVLVNDDRGDVTILCPTFLRGRLSVKRQGVSFGGAY